MTLQSYLSKILQGCLSLSEVVSLPPSPLFSSQEMEKYHTMSGNMNSRLQRGLGPKSLSTASTRTHGATTAGRYGTGSLAEGGMGRYSTMAAGSSLKGQHSLNKSKSIGNVGRSNYRLSVDNRIPRGFERVSSAGTCGLRERQPSGSPHLLGFSSLQPSPLSLSQASLISQTSQSSITSQVLDIAEIFGKSTSLQFLVEDAKKLHKKLLALSLDLDLDKVGLSEEVDSVGSDGVEERMSHQAWRAKSMSPFESVCVCVCYRASY